MKRPGQADRRTIASLVDLTNIPSLIAQASGMRWPRHRVSTEAVIGGTSESGSRFWRTLTWKLVTAVKPEALDPSLAASMAHSTADALFAVVLDPGERSPLLEQARWPTAAREARRRLEHTVEPYSDPATGEMDEETLDRLRALGYFR